MDKVNVYIQEGILYIRHSELSDEDKELFSSLFMLGKTCIGFHNETKHISCISDFERYIAIKESYIKKYGDILEFKENLRKHLGYVPYA